MLTTFVSVTVTCDTPGCHHSATRSTTGSIPRDLLASVRRSLRRRDAWQLGRRLLGTRDLCPRCALPEALGGGRPLDPFLPAPLDEGAGPDDLSADDDTSAADTADTPTAVVGTPTVTVAPRQ
jgi:hypothetical protein